MGKQKEVCKVLCGPLGLKGYVLVKIVSASHKLCTTEERGCVSEVEKLDENLYEKSSEEAGRRKRYYFENLKISLPQVKLSVFTSHKLPPDLKVKLTPQQQLSCYIFFCKSKL